MIKPIQSDETFNTPFISQKSWELTSNDSILTVEDGYFVSSSYNFYDSSSSYEYGYPLEPQNSNGTYKRLIYNLVKNAYYNNSVVNSFGLETLDSDKVVKILQNSLVRMTLPRVYFGEKIRPDSVVIIDSSKDKDYTIYDDKYGNLYVDGTNFINYTDITSRLYSAPFISFTASRISGSVPLTTVFSISQSGNATEYMWDFGDGPPLFRTSSAAVTHIYEDPGKYTVGLTATGIGGTTTTVRKSYISATVSIPSPVVDFIGTPTNEYYPFTASFTNLTTGATVYEWNFGDGSTSSLENPTHVYTTSGVYDVTLTAFGSGGSTTVTKSAYITSLATQVPTVTFYGNPLIGYAGVTLISFTGFVGGVGITGYSWNFGDNTSSAVQNPTHTYNTPGTYTVEFSASNAGGFGVTSIANYVTISAVPAPVAAFTFKPPTGDIPITVSFTNNTTGIGSITYLWDFGDTNTSTDVNPTHIYSSSAGTKTITLTATNLGGSSVVSQSIVLYDPSLRLQYSPSSQLMNWVGSDNTVYNNVTLASFDAIVDPTLVSVIEITSSAIPITTISNTDYYTPLKSLRIQNQNLTTLTSIGIPNLEEIDLTNNDLLSNLDLSDLPNLKTIVCKDNSALTSSLDVSGKSSLFWLDCSQNPNITNIDVTGNTDLSVIFAYLNPSLTSITGLSTCTNVTTLQLWNSNFTGSLLDLSGCSNLKAIQISGNPNLSAIDVTNNPLLDFLYCQDDNISSIDLTNNPELKTLGINGNILTSLDLTNNTKLTTLLAYQNTSLSSITGLSSLTDLVTFNVYNCSIPSINLTSNVNLETVVVGGTSLTSINLTSCTKLKLIDATNSISITTLNLPSTVPSLRTVRIGGLSLTQSEINSILVKLDANGLTGGTFNSADTGSSGSGTNAVPSGSGLTAKANLIAKGWSVITN